MADALTGRELEYKIPKAYNEDMASKILFCPDTLDDQQGAAFPTVFANQSARISRLSKAEEGRKALIQMRISRSLQNEMRDALERNPALRAAYSVDGE